MTSEARRAGMWELSNSWLIEHLEKKMDSPLGAISKVSRSEAEGNSSRRPSWEWKSIKQRGWQSWAERCGLPWGKGRRYKVCASLARGSVQASILWALGNFCMNPPPHTHRIPAYAYSLMSPEINVSVLLLKRHILIWLYDKRIVSWVRPALTPPRHFQSILFPSPPRTLVPCHTLDIWDIWDFFLK